MSESLYRDTLKDHMHHQRFAGRLELADLKAVVHNPLCGDELELTIVLGGDPSEGAQRPIQEARNQVRACSICVASASLMGESIQGLSLEEANNLGTTFREAMETGELPDSPPENVNISPKAWEVALELEVDVSTITPSGRRGRISVQDVEQVADPAKLAAYKGEEGADTGSVPSSDNPSELIPHSGMRKVIAERTTASKNTAPHFYLNVDLDAKKLSAEREKLNKGKDKKEKISINDLLIKCVASALTKHPEVNINWSDEGILQFKNADISIAVATDAGLITPIVKKANEKSVEEISSDTKRLSDLAHNNKLMPEDYQGGTFSISNLGMLGIKSFTAVINPPQCGILAVGKLEDDKISVTMSCDHRGIDGAVGARFLQTLADIVAKADI